MDVPHTLRLCASDTTDEERDGLIARGFVYKGTRGDLLLFDEPCEPDVDTIFESSVRYYAQAGGVRIRIVHGNCGCMDYHKDPAFFSFDYSQVALNGVFTRPPPVRRVMTADELAADTARKEDQRVRWAAIQESADNGSVQAQWAVQVVRLAREDQEQRNLEVLRALVNRAKN